jgi:hypothetical protein
MKLLILLENSEKDLKSIQHALGKFDCSLTVEKGKVIISTSSLVGHVDLKDNETISNVWEEVKDFVDIINGSAIVEGVSMNSVILHYIKYVDTDGEIKFLPNIGNMYAVLPGLRGSKPDISKFIPLVSCQSRNVISTAGRNLRFLSCEGSFEMTEYR